MTRTLVIQLGRLGDVVQATPLLGELAGAGDEVDVIVLYSTHAALLGCPAVANIITISDSLKPLDDAIACGFPHGAIPAEADELLADLHLPLYDRVINASHAPLGCWLAGAISCTNPDGRYGGVIRDSECLYLGDVSAYRVARLHFREQNLFNVVDLIRAAPGTEPPSGMPRCYANQSIELPFALPLGRRVALNPGASESARCWPVENFACLAESLAAAGIVPLLVGASGDRELCEKIESAARVAIPNFAGRTTIPEMAALLANCELLICGDTGAAHLAAAVGTTVVGLYGASAWFAESAPYGHDHLVLQTPLNARLSSISVDIVVAATLNRLGCLSIADLRSKLGAQNQSASETSIQPPSPTCDALGGLTYRPIHRDSFTPDELFAQSLRQSFANEFIALPETSSSPRIDAYSMQPAPSLGSADILAGSKAAQIFGADLDLKNRIHALSQILNYMRSVADLCIDSLRSGAMSSNASTGASTLIATMERLRASADDTDWRPLGPVVHYLDLATAHAPAAIPGSDISFVRAGLCSRLPHLEKRERKPTIHGSRRLLSG